MFISNSKSIDEYEGSIREKWQDNVSNILEVGRMLADAKGTKTSPGTLSKQEFHELTVVRLKFSKSTVNKLIKISNDDRIKGASHANLPPRWETLYQLTTLTDEEFERGIESGSIHAGMERKVVTELKPKKEKKNSQKFEPKSNIRSKDKVFVTEFQRHLDEVAWELDGERREDFFDRLKAIIAQASNVWHHR